MAYVTLFDKKVHLFCRKKQNKAKTTFIHLTLIFKRHQLRSPPQTPLLTDGLSLSP